MSGTISWSCTPPVPPHLLKAAAACAPGTRDNRVLPVPLLDVVCIHAAACDLAIADAGFRSTFIMSSVAVMALLHDKAHKAHKDFPTSPDTEGLHAAMDFQDMRLVAAGVKVRSSWPLSQAWYVCSRV